MPPLRHKLKKRLTLFLIICLLMALLLSGCTARVENVFFNTDCSIEIKGAGSTSKIEEIETLLNRLENALSTSVASSDVARVNAAPANVAVGVDQDFITLYKRSLALTQTYPAFNPFIFPLVELWKFSPDTFTEYPDSIPTESEIAALLPVCTSDSFAFDEAAGTITKLTEGAKLDFGAIAKGYAADLAAEIAQKNYVINIGGTLKTDKTISVAVASPRGSGYAASFTLAGGATATSGDYERYYLFDGVRYGHILASNGSPAGLGEISPVISVTVVGADAWLCDALSTLLFIEGSLIADYVENLGYSALLLTEDTYCTIGDIDFDILESRERV